MVFSIRPFTTRAARSSSSFTRTALMIGVEIVLEALMISLIRGTPRVTFIDATPAKWNVLSVIWVPGSPIECAPIAPTAVPGSTLALRLVQHRSDSTLFSQLGKSVALGLDVASHRVVEVPLRVVSVHVLEPVKVGLAHTPAQVVHTNQLRLQRTQHRVCDRHDLIRIQSAFAVVQTDIERMVPCSVEVDRSGITLHVQRVQTVSTVVELHNAVAGVPHGLVCFFPSPRVDLSMTPDRIWEFLMITNPSFGAISLGMPGSGGMNVLFLASRLMITLELLFGRISKLNSCFPVHIYDGLKIAGGGISIWVAPSDIIASICANVARSQQVVLHTHQVHGLCTGLLCLWNVQVHLVSIEIGVVRSTNTLVQTERSPWPDLGEMAHDRQTVQRRLSVEQNDVSVLDVSLHNVSNRQLFGQLVTVTITQVSLNVLVFLHQIVGTRMNIRSVDHQFLQLGLVVPRHLLRIRQHFGDSVWNSHLVDPQVGIGRDHSSS
ncbi:hypothetical protein OGAPHI_001496 [Ogataea philodendri]|uniref:Uncharacterized protein n=1 Tax=Ogataea philodendri TaxID=1378263 RepID=A0A9P8PCW8_9ASCO|nr:uncharacterized protein OGAPHI_001496 [Ogataea philodendri]KAH3669375.1 hypothetical protein OGAPHI_001496 [Ogataea philodendri]